LGKGNLRKRRGGGITVREREEGEFYWEVYALIPKKKTGKSPERYSSKCLRIDLNGETVSEFQ